MKTVTKTLLALCLTSLSGISNASDQPWQETLNTAKGQTVYFNAWGGSQSINDYINWAGKQAKAQYGIEVEHVKVTDTGDVVSRVLAEKTAGRSENGSVDLVWINGENFRAMKENNLLGEAFTQSLPNYALVDTENKPTTLVDFTTPVDNLEAPWGMAQLVFMYDSEIIKTPPTSMQTLLAQSTQTPGIATYPAPPSFHGTTFIKQALLELTEDHSVLYQDVSQSDFDQITAPLWAYLDQLHPLMWRKGQTFPKGAPEMTQLLNDSEIAISLSFNPNDASNAIEKDELPDTIRTYIHNDGTIGNTHFVAIPYNAKAREAAMVFANFLMSPEAQAKKADTRVWGDSTVLSMAKLNATEKALFDALPRGKATLSPEDLSKVINEPHASWVEALEKAWQERYGQ